MKEATEGSLAIPFLMGNLLFTMFSHDGLRMFLALTLTSTGAYLGFFTRERQSLFPESQLGTQIQPPPHLLAKGLKWGKPQQCRKKGLDSAQAHTQIPFSVTLLTESAELCGNTFETTPTHLISTEKLAQRTGPLLPNCSPLFFFFPK